MGEWANSGSVKPLTFSEFHLDGQDASFYINVHDYLFFLLKRFLMLAFPFDSTEFGKNTSSESNLIRLQTLYHADKQKTDAYILELVTWLHQLINLVRHCDHGLKPLPIRSPTRRGLDLHSKMQRMQSMDYSTNKTRRIQLSEEDRNLLDDVIGRMKRVPGISKSQEFAMSKKRGTKAWALSKSTGSSPPRELNAGGNIDQPKANPLDVIDGLG